LNNFQCFILPVPKTCPANAFICSFPLFCFPRRRTLYANKLHFYEQLSMGGTICSWVLVYTVKLLSQTFRNLDLDHNVLLILKITFQNLNKIKAKKEVSLISFNRTLFLDVTENILQKFQTLYDLFIVFRNSWLSYMFVINTYTGNRNE